MALASDVTTLRSVVVVASLGWRLFAAVAAQPAAHTKMRLFAALASDVTTIGLVDLLVGRPPTCPGMWKITETFLNGPVSAARIGRFGCGPSAPGRSAPRRMGDGVSSAIKDRGCALMAPR